MYGLKTRASRGCIIINMEPKTIWKCLDESLLIQIPDTNIIPGNNSVEKMIQCLRKATSKEVIYTSKDSIPDSPQEPYRLEVSKFPSVQIPLEDTTGISNTFSYESWPDSKGHQPTLNTNGFGIPLFQPHQLRPNYGNQLINEPFQPQGNHFIYENPQFPRNQFIHGYPQYQGNPSFNGNSQFPGNRFINNYHQFQGNQLMNRNPQFPRNQFMNRNPQFPRNQFMNSYPQYQGNQLIHRYQPFQHYHLMHRNFQLQRNQQINGIAPLGGDERVHIFPRFSNPLYTTNPVNPNQGQFFPRERPDLTPNSLDSDPNSRRDLNKFAIQKKLKNVNNMRRQDNN